MIRPTRPEGAAVLQELQELQTAQNTINNAQDDRSNNILKALQELNYAAEENLKLNQQIRLQKRRPRSRNKTSTLTNYTPKGFPHILSFKTTLRESDRS